MLDKHFSGQPAMQAKAGASKAAPKGKPVYYVWESMNMDRLLSAQAVEKRKAM